MRGAQWQAVRRRFAGLLAGVICFTGLISVGATAAGAAAVPQSSGPRWAWQNPLPTGNDLGGVSCPSASVCYIGGVAGAVLVTMDGGTTWASQSLGIPDVSGAVKCPSAIVCFVSAGEKILHTTDGGHTWSRQYSPITAQPPIVEDVGPFGCPTSSTCFALVRTGSAHPGPGYIIATTDAGQTWVNQTPGGAGQLGSIDCPDARTCYASGEFGSVLATTDGGSTWSTQNSTVNEGLGQVSCPTRSFCAIAGGGSGVVTTTNGGTTWTAHPTTVSSAGQLGGMSCPSISMCIATGMDNGSTPNMIAIRSGDGGATWHTVYFPSIPGALDRIDCGSTSNCVAVGRHGWIALTRDGGTTWTSPSSGPSTPLHGISCPTDQTCFAAGNAGLVLKTSNGGSWTNVASTGVTTNLSGISCADTSHCTAVGLTGTMIQTADGGAHWTAIPWGPTISWGVPEDLFAVSCPTAAHCVAVGQYSTVLVIDNGVTKVPSGGFPYSVYGVSCPSATSCYLVGSADAFFMPQTGAILASADGGTNWTHLHSNDPSDIQAISCTAGTTACTAVDNVGNMVSSTDGANWSVRQVSGNWLNGVSCPAPGRCVAVSMYTGIITTNDGGVTAQTVPAITGNGLFGASCPRVGNCTVVGDSGTILAMRSRFMPPTVPAAAPRSVVRTAQPAIPGRSRTAPSTQATRLVDRAAALATTSASRSEVPPEARLVWSDVLKFLQGLGAFGTAH
jgi:photosystem II stability/assembly factor-like uncharacterized protein